jgi:hypothetical protein
LVFWLHPTGDILYHRNLKTKRGFFYFLDSYIFFGVKIQREEGAAYFQMASPFQKYCAFYRKIRTSPYFFRKGLDGELEQKMKDD